MMVTDMTQAPKNILIFQELEQLVKKSVLSQLSAVSMKIFLIKCTESKRTGNQMINIFGYETNKDD